MGVWVKSKGGTADRWSIHTRVVGLFSSRSDLVFKLLLLPTAHESYADDDDDDDVVLISLSYVSFFSKKGGGVLCTVSQKQFKARPSVAAYPEPITSSSSTSSLLLFGV